MEAAAHAAEQAAKVWKMAVPWGRLQDSMGRTLGRTLGLIIMPYCYGRA